MEKFLDSYDLPKVIKHLNRSIASNEIETVTKSLQRRAQDCINSLLNSMNAPQTIP
jgi:hypothetical protein